MRVKTAVCIAVLGLAHLVLRPACDAQGPADAEDQTLRAMHAMGVMQPALNYIRARAKLEKTGPTLAWWAMREMECHARWAMQDSANAAQHWTDCDVVVTEYKAKVLGNGKPMNDPRWPWIEWQIGRCRLLKAQASLASYLAAPSDLDNRDQALELVRDVLTHMVELSKEISQRQPIAARQSLNDPTEAPAEQLRNLEADAQLLMCEALMVRWQLYPVGSNDRAASLADVRSTALEFLRTRTDPMGQASLQYAAAIAELETGDLAALAKLEQLSQRAKSLQIRMLAATALARALARDNQHSRARTAMELAEQVAALDPSLGPHVGLAAIEVSLMRLESSKASNKESELSELVKQAEQLGIAHGDYWRTRAEALLVGKLSSDSVSDSRLAMDLLLAEAKQLVGKGDESSIRQAAQKLLQGRDVQAKQAKGAAAISLSNKAATLYRELKSWDEVIAAVRDTSTQFASESGAADSHLIAVEAQIQRVKQASKELVQRELDLCIELEQQQLRLWPESEVSQQVKSWLRNKCLGLNRRELYVESLLSMLPACKNSELGQSLVLECCEQTLQLTSAQQKLVFEKWLRSVSSGNYPLAAVSKHACLAVGILADVMTSEFPRSTEMRQQNWNEFEESRGRIDAGVVSAFMNCVSDIGRAQLQLPFNERSTGWNSLADSTRAALVGALVDAVDSSAPTTRAALLSHLELDTNWAAFQKAGLNSATVAAAERVAQWLGDPQAGGRLKQLAEKQKRDGLVQLLYSYWLAENNDYVAAKKVVTQLAGLSPVGSPLQLSARWSLMRFQSASGEQAEATKAAKLLLASQSEMDASWSERFKSIAK